MFQIYSSNIKEIIINIYLIFNIPLALIKIKFFFAAVEIFLSFAVVLIDKKHCRGFPSKIIVALSLSVLVKVRYLDVYDEDG